MNQEILILTATAATIAFVHTILGPDHYLPFIVMSKARNWSMAKTSWITFLCGIGHVMSSIILGTLGIILGIGVQKLEFFESVRGNWAAWAFITFGLVYMIWGLRKAYRKKPHEHAHSHGGFAHIHEHSHHEDHAHVHNEENGAQKNLTPWILFLIFVLGPCEPLIPILMYPAATHSTAGIVIVSVVFSIITIATMISIVLLTTMGIKIIPTGRLEKFTHAIAGATILLSGLAIVFLGL